MPSIRASTVSKGLSALFAFLFAAAAGAVPRELPTARALLKRVLEAEERVPFRGEQTVTVWTDGKQSQILSREYHLSARTSRVEFTSPRDIAGRLVVNDGERRWEYNPVEHVVVRSRILRQPVSSSSITTTMGRVFRAYSVVVAKDLPRIAGRTTYRLVFGPHAKGGDTKTWWVDQISAVVLRRDVTDPAGHPRQSSAYRRIEFRPRFHRDLVRFKVPPGARVLNSPDQGLAFSSISRAKKSLPAWARISSRLAGGFEFDYARIVKNNGIETVQVQYTDGLVGLSLFLAPIATTSKSATGGAREVELGATKGSLVHSVPPYRVLTWTRGGKTYSLVGDMSDQLMVEIARQLAASS